MKKNIYCITYDVKKNRKQFERKIYIYADTSKEAKNYFLREFNGNSFYGYDNGHHAFHVEVKKIGWDVILDIRWAVIESKSN